MEARITLTGAEKRLMKAILASRGIGRERRIALFAWSVVAPAGCAAVLLWGYRAHLLRESIVPAIGLAGLISAIGYARLMHYRLYRIIKSLSDENGPGAGR